MTGRDLCEPGHSGEPVRLKKRSDFLRAATGRKIHAALFTVQAVRQDTAEPSQSRIGFTVTKKVGGAVERNRIRRRLREAVRVAPDLGIKPSHDYVIVARRAVLDQPFAGLLSGLRSTLARLDRPENTNWRSDRHRGGASDKPRSAPKT